MASREEVSGSTGVGHLPTALPGDRSAVLSDTWPSRESHRLFRSGNGSEDYGQDQLSPFQQKVQKLRERRHHLRSRLRLKRSQFSASRRRNTRERDASAEHPDGEGVIQRPEEEEEPTSHLSASPLPGTRPAGRPSPSAGAGRSERRRKSSLLFSSRQDHEARKRRDGEREGIGDARRKGRRAGRWGGAASFLWCPSLVKKPPAVGACLAAGVPGVSSGRGRGKVLSGVGGLEVKSVADVLKFLQGKGSEPTFLLSQPARKTLLWGLSDPLVLLAFYAHLESIRISRILAVLGQKPVCPITPAAQEYGSVSGNQLLMLDVLHTLFYSRSYIPRARVSEFTQRLVEPCLLLLQASGLVSPDLMPLTVTSLASPTAHRQHHLFEATYQRYLDAFNAHAYAKSPRRNEGSRNVAAKPPVSALALPGGTGASEPGTRAVDGEAAAREERDEEGRDLPGDGSSGSVPPPRVSGGLTSGGVVQEREGTLPLLSVQGAGLGRGAEIFGRELRTHKNGRDAVGSGSLSLESDSPTVTYAEEVACWAAQIKLTLTTSDSAEVESARLAFLRQTRSLLVKQLMLPWKEFVADVLPQFLREVHDARFRITGAIMDNVWKLRDQLEAATGVAAAPNANPPGVRCFGEELSSRPRPALPPESGSVCLGESVPNKGPGHCNGTFSFPTRGVHEGDKGGDPGSSGCSVSLSRTATQQLQSGGEGAREGAVSSKAMKQSGGSGSQNSVRLVGSGRGHETGVGVRAADVTGISTREPASTRCSLDLRSEDAAEAPRSPLPASGGARSGEAMAPLGTGRASKGGSVEFASASQLQPIGEDRVLASSASNSFSVSRAGSGEDTAEEGGRFGGVIRSKVGPSISSGTPVGVVTHMEHPGPGPYVRGGGAEGSGCDTSSSGTSGLSGVSATHVALDKAHSSNNTSTSVASSASAHVSVSQGSSASCVPTKKSEPFPPAGHHHAASKGGQSLIFTEQFSSDRSTAQAIGNLSQYESEGGTRVYGSSADFGEPPLHMGVTRMSPVGPAAEALEDFAWSNMTVGGGKGGGAGRSKSLTSKAPRAFGLVKMDALHPTKGLWGRGGGKKRDEEELNANVGGRAVREDSPFYALTFVMMVGMQMSNELNACIVTMRHEPESSIDLDFLLEEPLLLPVRQFHFCCYPQLPRTFFCVFDDLAPDTFECARELAGVTEQDYRSSVCRTDFSFIEFESNSKSGQFFLFSHDGKYLIKTISQREVKQVLKILPAYIDHLLTNPNSLLTRLFGLHRVEIYKRYDLEEEAPGGVSQEVEWSSRRSHTGGTDSQLDPRREDTSRTVTDRGSSGGSRRRPTIGSGGRHVSVAVPPEGASSGVTREFENDPVVSADGGGSGTASQSDFTRGGSSDSLACSWMPDESTAGDMASSDAVTGGKTMHLLLPSRTSAGVETSRTTGQAKATSRDSQRSSLSETRHTEYSVAEVACDPQLLREDKERSDRELFGSALNFCSTQLHAGEMSALYASDEGRSASLRAPSDPGSDASGQRGGGSGAAVDYTQTQRGILAAPGESHPTSGSAGSAPGRPPATYGSRRPSSSAASGLHATGSADRGSCAGGETQRGPTARSRRGRHDHGGRFLEEDTSGMGKRSSTQGTYLSGVFSSGAGTSSSKAKTTRFAADSVRASLRWVDSSSGSNSARSRLDEGTFALPKSVHLGSTVESERATSHLHGKGIGGHGRSTTRYTPLPVDTDIDAEIEGSPPPAALHTPGPTARQKTCRDPSSKRDHVKSASKNSAVDGVPGPASGGESGVTAGSTHGSARKTARGGRESVNAGSNQGRNRKSQLRYTRGATFAVRDEARKESVTCAYFAVIGTAFDPFLGLHAAYDLKGSTVSRRAKPDDRVKKDVDWIEQDRRLEVREEEADEILRAHHFDCQFLETIGVFDYSLLVGIHKCKRQVVAQMASGAGSGLGEPSSGEGIGQGEGPLRQYTRIRQGSVAESGAGATEPSSGGSNVELQSLSGVISSSDDPGDRAPAEATVPGSPQRVAAVSAVHRHSLPFGVSLSGRSDSELGVQAQRNGSEDNPPVSVQAHEVSEAGGTTSVLPPSVLLSRGTGLPDNSHIGRRFTCERSQQFSSSPPRTDPSMAPAAPQSVGSLTAKRAKNSRAEKGVDGLMELESRVRDGCAAELQSSSVWSPRGELTVGEEIDADTSWECESAEHGRSPGEGDQQSGRGRMCPARPPTQLQVQGAAVGERGCPKDLTGSHASLTPISDLCWQQKGEYGRHGKDAAADDNKLPQYSSFVRHSGVHGAEHRQRDSGRSSRDILLERRSSSVSCPPSQVSTPRVWLPPRTVQGTAVVSTARHDYLAALSTSSEVLKCLTGGRETAGLRDRCFRSSLFVMASPPTCRTPPSGDAATPVRPVNERSPLQQALVALQNQPPPRCPGPVTQRVFATARGDVATLNQVELSGSSVVGGAGDESGDRLVEGGDNTTKGCMPTHHLSQRSLLGKSNQGGRGASTGRRRGRSEPAGCSPRTESKRTEGERDAILLRSCGQPSSRTPGGGGECTSFTPTPSSGAVSGCDSAGGGRRPGCEGLEALEEAEGQPSGGRKAFQQSIQAGDSLPRNRKPAQTDLDRRLSDASSRLPYANTICSFYNRTLETPYMSPPSPDSGFGVKVMSADLSEIYYLGIIDFLTPYDFRRYGHTAYKRIRSSFKCEFGEISPVPPRYYSRRQQEFVRSQVIEVTEIGRVTSRPQLVASGDGGKPDKITGEEEGKREATGEVKAVGLAAAMSEVREFAGETEEERLKRILRQVDQRTRQENLPAGTSERKAGKPENSEQGPTPGGKRRRSTFFNLYNFAKP